MSVRGEWLFLAIHLILILLQDGFGKYEFQDQVIEKKELL